MLFHSVEGLGEGAAIGDGAVRWLLGEVDEASECAWAASMPIGMTMIRLTTDNS